MPRNRIINLSIWSSKRLNRVSIESILLYIGVLNFADDYGALEFSSRQIWGNVFPYRDDISIKNVEKWIDELISSGVLMKVLVNGRDYLLIYKWESYQKVVNPSKRRHLNGDDQRELYRAYIESNESIYRPNVCNKDKDKDKDIKEKIKKENFPKENYEERKRNLARKLLADTWTKYDPQMIRDFYEYWNETNENSYKMRFEKEKTWELGKRLANWAQRGKGKYKHPIPKTEYELNQEKEANYRDNEEKHSELKNTPDFHRRDSDPIILGSME